MQHRNLQLIHGDNRSSTHPQMVSAQSVSVSTHTLKVQGGSLVDLPDDDPQDEHSNGAHQSKNTHLPAGFLLEQKKRGDDK